MRGLATAVAAFLLLSGGACAQERSSSVVEALSGIPVPTRYQSAEASRTRYAFDCQGRHYTVELSETAVEAPELRRVALVSLETPAGGLGAVDREQLESALEPYFLMFHVGVQCREGVSGLTFTGRRRGKADNDSFVAWFENGRLTAIR